MIPCLYYDTDISFHGQKQDNAKASLALLPNELNEFIKINVINRHQYTHRSHYREFHFDPARGVAWKYFINY